MSSSNRYTDRLFGLTGVLFTLIVGLVVTAGGVLVALPLWILLVIAVPIIAIAGILFTLTIEVGSRQVCWSFTFGAFRRCVPYADIVDVQAVTGGSTFGWGYRFEGHRKAWVASGNAFIVIRTRSGEQLSVNVRDAEAVVSAIQQRLREPSVS